jgi:hypothetical protein
MGRVLGHLQRPLGEEESVDALVCAFAARQAVKIAETLFADLQEVWVAQSWSGKLATIAYGLLPRDVFISVRAEDAWQSRT